MVYDKHRERAESLRSLGAQLLDATDLATNPQKQIKVLAALNEAATLDAVADLAEWLERILPGSRIRERMSFNDRIRIAAAKGDWDEFDRIISGRGPEEAGPAGGDPESSPQPES